MKLLLDHDVYACTGRFLVEEGHDVLLAKEVGCSRASDDELLGRAGEMGRILVTRDRDFGALVFLRKVGAGVIYLRIPPARVTAGHEQLSVVLTSHSEEELRNAFVVVEPAKHRFRKLPR